MLLRNHTKTAEAIRERLARILGPPSPVRATPPEAWHRGRTAADPDEPGVPHEPAVPRGDDESCTEVVAADEADATEAAVPPEKLAPSAAPTPGAVHARFDPGRRGLRALVVVVIAVVTVAAAIAWRSRPVPEPAPASLAGTPAVAGSSAAELVVAVAGRVRRPGLVRLPTGARWPTRSTRPEGRCQAPT